MTHNIRQTPRQTDSRLVSLRTGVLLATMLSGTCLQTAAAQGANEFLGIETERFPGPINTERPTFSATPLPLASGHAQIEGGVQYTNGDGGANTFTVPQGLLRLGILSNLELQLGWEGYTFGNNFDDGGNDITLAGKTQITRQDGYLPAIALQPGVTIDTGSGDATSNSVDPRLGINWAYSLAGPGLFGRPGQGVFGTVQFSSLERNDNDRLLETAVSVGASAPVNNRLGAFVEYVGFVRSDAVDDAHNLNGGVTYQLSRDFQVDASTGFGLTSEADDFFVGAGAAYRW